MNEVEIEFLYEFYTYSDSINIWVLNIETVIIL